MTHRFERWFSLTHEERMLVVGAAAIVLVGLVARYWHQRTRAEKPYAPPGLEQEVAP
jgi:hypothetical protein